MKICIKPIISKEQSKEVQEKTFKLGYGWQGKYKEIRSYDIIGLYFNTGDNSITYSAISENQCYSHIVLTPEEFINADIKKSDWVNWIMVEKQEEQNAPIYSRWELLDL